MRHGDSANPEAIVPVAYSPPGKGGWAFEFRWRWLYLAAALFALLGGTAIWFVLTAKSIYIEVEPNAAAVELSGGFSFKVGPRHLIRSGSYQLKLSHPGFLDNTSTLTVGEEPAQIARFQLTPLPGTVTFATPGLDGARLTLDGADIGVTPLAGLTLEAGEYELALRHERYRDLRQTIVVEGRGIHQDFAFEPEPAWAEVTVASEPPGAELLVDGASVGRTPVVAEILEGDREIMLKLPRHKAWRQALEVTAGEPLMLPRVTLEPADGLVFVRSEPSGASVTVAGEFKGLTPLEVELPPGGPYEVALFREGYHPTREMVRVNPEMQRDVMIELRPHLVAVRFQAEPADAELYVDGAFRGPANQTLELVAADQEIEIRKEGYVPYVASFVPRPGLDQLIRANLQSQEQARREQLGVISNAVGQTLRLYTPTGFTMGSSRREAGRRPNETLRDVQLQRLFYLAETETTNAQFLRFNPEHSSGTAFGISLGNPSQPVVRVSWEQAALYCNWLSEQESLPLFYEVSDGRVVGFNPDSNGYRLPTEAEWAWAARVDRNGLSLRYPWGERMPPPPGSGNFADNAAQTYLDEVLMEYNDGVAVSAPVGSFQPNGRGLYDLAGNVAEWVHDFYGSIGIGGDVPVDPLGPENGEFHVIRGSSWAQASVTQIRLSHRDFGVEPRFDLGFRVARYLDEE